MRTTRIPALTLAGALLASSLIIPAAQAAQQPVRQDAAAILATLTVTPTQEDVPGYTQKSFTYPKHRADLGSKADQWDWVMTRDFDKATLKTTDGNVTYGELKNDPYSGQTITYEGKAGAVDIEHVVARSEAWDSGASKWTQEKRDEFANDPLETMAVSASGNRSHGEKDAAKWLPSSGSPLFPKGNPSYDCEYVARQIAVKAKYGLTVDRAEHDAMAKTLASCPTQTLPLDTDGEYWGDNPAPTVSYSLSDLKGIAPTRRDGAATEGFDYRSDALPDSPVPYTGFDHLPQGWTVKASYKAGAQIADPTRNEYVSWAAGTGTLTVTSPDGSFSKTYGYTATPLMGMHVTLDGVDVGHVDAADAPEGVDAASLVRFSGVPDGYATRVTRTSDGLRLEVTSGKWTVWRHDLTIRTVKADAAKPDVAAGAATPSTAGNGKTAGTGDSPILAATGSPIAGLAVLVAACLSLAAGLRRMVGAER